jgi:hypothetical protein
MMMQIAMQIAPTRYLVGRDARGGRNVRCSEADGSALTASVSTPEAPGAITLVGTLVTTGSVS